MRHKHNADQTDSESATSDKDSTVDVSLHWIHRQISRVLEIFIILQFVTGAFIFFVGIFLLLFAVAPATSLKAGSYMLLAFYIIGRALIGLFGNSTDNFCLLASYGVLLVATCVVRTILTLVHLKITTGADDQLAIPPLLQAMPGALSAPIELISSAFECSQAVCAFYLCWIIAKTASIEKSVEESRLNIATEIAKYLTQQQEIKKKDEENEADKKKILTVKPNEKCNETDPVCDEKHGPNESRESGSNQTPTQGVKQVKGQQVPLKSILHHPSVHSEPHKQPTQQHHQESEQVDYWQQYRQYPHKGTTRPPRPTHLYQNHSFREFQPKADHEVETSKRVDDEEDLDQLVDDYNNNNNGPLGTVGYNQTNGGHYVDEMPAHLQWGPPPMHVNPNLEYAHQPPEYMDVAMLRGMQPEMSPLEMTRAVSPTPPSELNLSSPSSPLLYNNRMAAYNDYGSTNGQMRYQQQQQYHLHPQMYR